MANKSNNSVMVPQARAAMDKFKMEAANEVGVQLKEGYNGDITSRQAGSIGGQMVNLMMPKRHYTFDRANRTVIGHKQGIVFTVQAGI